MPNWTKEQQNAIDARNCNILVSAAAGSGKTAVLVERVLQRMLDVSNPVNIDRMLIVTFTNAAAAEMKARINRALTDFIRQFPNHSNALHQLSLLPGAKICTIDSFCINLVRDNFFKLGIAQDFKILEDSQRSVLEQSVLDSIVEQLYQEDDETFRQLVELLSTTKNNDDLMKAVKRIDHYITSQPFPLEWLEETAQLYRPDLTFDSSEFKHYLVKEINAYLDYFKQVISQTQSVLYPEDELFDKYSNVLNADIKIINTFEEALDKTWDEIKEVAQSVKFSTTPYKRNYTSKVKEIVSDNRKVYAGADGMFKKDILPMLSATSDEIKQDNEILYPLLQKLIELVKQFHSGVMELKHELNAYTFSDIEHFAIELLFTRDEQGRLERSDIAKELESSFDEILVDEYQDTNAAQNTLFEMLSSGRNRFMVGDVKQSIYRFRLAEPHIFNAMKDRYSSYQKNSTDAEQKIILDKNFRSRKGICDFTNFVFSKIMSRKTGEINYDASEYLNYGAQYPDTSTPSVQLNLMQTPEGDDSVTYEAHQLAKYITDKVNSGELIQDGDVQRPIRYGDFAVLLRSAKSSMPVYTKILSEHGIPVFANNKTNLFDTNEVAILVSYLRVIDNPMQDIPLLATLMSVFYGYTPDDIAYARIHFKANNLYTSISQDKEHFSRFLEEIAKYRKYASTMCVEDFLRQLLSDTSYLAVIAAMGNGEQRKLNVLKLIDLARNFDRGENVGLTAFVRYIDSITEAKLAVEGADAAYMTDNKVSIMSVHKSKGLEFPVCILADASHQFNKDDLKDLIMLNNQYGVGLKVNNEEGLYRYNSIQYDCIKSINRNELMSENLRVLYVAITRAKEQFVCFASLKNLESINRLSKKIIGNSINPIVVSKAMNDAELLLLCALQHKDGAILRSLCSADIPVDTSFDFEMQINLLDGEFEEPVQTDIQVPYDASLTEQIAKRLSYRYERTALSGYASKRTASALDETDSGYQYVATSQPSFMNTTGMTAAERGTAMHEFMQHCDYSNAKTNLDKEIKRLTEHAFLTEQQAQSLSREKLSHFFNSDFARRMFDSDRIYRELKVSSFVPLNELEDTDYTDKVLIQGIADCVFEENGELVLVDYKTDKTDSEEELLQRYQKQVAFYKSAVEKTLEKPVKEMLLYSFYLEKTCIYK